MAAEDQEQSAATDDLVLQAMKGDQGALAQLFHLHRQRLKHMVELRLDRRLQGRVDPSDVLQDAYLDASRRLPEYAGNTNMPFFLWLRFLTSQRMVDLQRRHLGAAMRDVQQEVSLFHGALPAASSVSLAAHLLGQLTTASQAAIRAETQQRVQEALNTMDAIDREVLALRHFEMLSNEEVSLVLGIKKTAASNRYVRALRRLKQILASIPGLMG